MSPEFRASGWVSLKSLSNIKVKLSRKCAQPHRLQTYMEYIVLSSFHKESSFLMGCQLDSSRLFSIKMPSWYHLSTVTGILGVEQSGLVIGSSIQFTSWIVISPVFPEHIRRKQLWPEAEWEDYSLHLPLMAIFLELGGKSSWLLTLLLFLIVHSFAKTWQDKVWN